MTHIWQVFISAQWIWTVIAESRLEEIRWWLVWWWSTLTGTWRWLLQRNPWKVVWVRYLIKPYGFFDDFYLIYGIGSQRIYTKGIACSKVFFLYPKGNLVKKWDNSTEKLPESLVGLEPLAAWIHVRCLEASCHRTRVFVSWMLFMIFIWFTG